MENTANPKNPKNPPLTLYLFRGWQGSGKSTAAQQLMKAGMVSRVVESDDYYYDEDGVYRYHPSKANMAHAACHEAVRKELSAGNSVAVANVLAYLNQLEPYIALAKQYRAQLVVTDCKGNYPSVHNVPAHVIEGTKRKFEAFEQ
jgi:predicted kinase